MKKMNSNETESLIDRYKGAPDLDGFMGFACDAAPKKPQTLAQHLKQYHHGQMPKGDCSWLKQYKKDHPDWQKEAAKLGGGKATKKEAAVDTAKKTTIGKRVVKKQSHADIVKKNKANFLKEHPLPFQWRMVVPRTVLGSQNGAAYEVLEDANGLRIDFSTFESQAQFAVDTLNKKYKAGETLEMRDRFGIPPSQRDMVAPFKVVTVEDDPYNKFKFEDANGKQAYFGNYERECAKSIEEVYGKGAEGKGDGSKISDSAKELLERRIRREYQTMRSSSDEVESVEFDGDNVKFVATGSFIDSEDYDKQEGEYFKKVAEYAEKSDGITLSDPKISVEKFDTGRKYERDYAPMNIKAGNPIYGRRITITAKVDAAEHDRREKDRNDRLEQVEKSVKRQKDYKFNDPDVPLSEKGFRQGDVYSFPLDGKTRKGKVYSISGKASSGWTGIGIEDLETGKKYVCNEDALCVLNPITLGVTISADGKYGKKERVGDFDTAKDRLIAIEKSEGEDGLESLEALHFRKMESGYSYTTRIGYGIDVAFPGNSTDEKAYQSAIKQVEDYRRKQNPRRMWRDQKWVIQVNGQAKHLFHSNSGEYTDWDSEHRTYAGIFPVTFASKREAQSYIDKKGMGRAWRVDTCGIADVDGMANEVAKRLGVKVKQTNFDSFTDTDGKKHDLKEYFDWNTDN